LPGENFCVRWKNPMAAKKTFEEAMTQLEDIVKEL